MALFQFIVASFGVVAISSAGFVPSYTTVPADTITSTVLGQHAYAAALPTVGGFSKTISYGAPSAPVIAAAAPAFEKTIATSYGAPASFSKTISYASPLPVAGTFVATPAVASAAIHKTISYGATPVVTAVAQPPARPSFHQVVLGNRQRDVRVEEYQRPEQLIRIQEAAQPEPEVVKFNAPSEEPSTVRVINRAAPAPRVEHVVAKQGGFQVYNIEKPANPADRLIHITRGPAPPARVEFFNEGHDATAEIRLTDTPNRPHVEYGGAAVNTYSAPIAARTISYGAAGPVAATVVAPVAAVQKTISYAAPAAVLAPPAVHKTISYGAPAAVLATPAVHKTISYGAPAAVLATPAVHKTISYGAPAAVLATPAVHKTISYGAPPTTFVSAAAVPTVQKTVSYTAPATTFVAAPAIEKTVSYAAPAVHKSTISYSAPATTTVIGAPVVHKTVEYRAPAIEKTISYGAGSNFANTYTTTADDFRRAAKNL